MIVKCMYFDKRFKNKPTKWDTVKLQGYTEKNSGIYHKPLLTPKEIDIKELAEGLANGATFKPAVLSGTTNNTWTQQQLFALDFDHDTTIDVELEKCKRLNIMPCFGYTSFSHADIEHRFRLVFCTENIITDITIRNNLQIALMTIFDNGKSIDEKAKDPSRIFYGGRGLICNDYDNRINIDHVIKLYSDIKPTVDIKKEANNSKQKAVSKSCLNNAPINSNQYIEAIKNLDVKALQSLLLKTADSADPEQKGNTITKLFSLQYHLPVKNFSNKGELYSYINSIDLNKYLNLYGKFNCILPDHIDNNPSANIYSTDDGTAVYYCFGCGRCFTIVSLTEILAGCKRSQAIEFIKSVYNLKLIESEWTVKQKDMLIDNANYLDSDDFKLTYPTLNNLIRTRKSHIKAILMYFTQYISDDMQIDGKPYFYASYDALMNACGIKGNRNTMSQTLILFTLIALLNKLNPDSIPPEELAKAKEIAAKLNYKKLTNYYSVDEYGTLLLKNSEEIAKDLKRNNMTLKGLSKEYILRTFGTKLADAVFPQYKAENRKGYTMKSDQHTLDITESIFKLIDNKGYATEKEIVYMLGNKYPYDQTEIQIKKSLTEIMLAYGLVRVRASKTNKELYSINDDNTSYQSYIICRQLD